MEKPAAKPAERSDEGAVVAVLREEVERLRLENTELSARLCDMAARLAGAQPDLSVASDAACQDALRNLVMAAELKDHDTGAHLVRIGYFSALLASCCGYGKSFVQLMLVASPMHDVGKIGIPDRILKKRTSLSDDERSIMESHTLFGARILDGSDAPPLKLASEIALTHHERFDGSGYPRGLRAGAIPLSGRIVAVTDVLDALVMDRSYRTAMPWEQAVDLIRAGRGSHFDPDIVDAFLGLEDQIVDLYETLSAGLAPQRIPGLDEATDLDPLSFYDASLNTAAVGEPRPPKTPEDWILC